MFAFVLADSLPRLFNDYARPTSVDRVVVKIAGRNVRRSDLERLRVQRIRANFVLSQLGLTLGDMVVAPYFEAQTFGATDDEAMVDALLLERKANTMRIPRAPDLARNWIFEQARMRHELYRNLQPTLPAFNAVNLATQLEVVFNQTFGREMTESDFLAEVSDQVRILQTLELLSQGMDTPLDAFEVYSDRLVEVEARYVAFPSKDYLDEVSSPDSETLRAFFAQNNDRLPDPNSGTIGFRVPRRIKVEYLALGINAIDVIREQIRGEPLDEAIRSSERFEEEVLERYQSELQQRESALFVQALPVNPFTDPVDNEEIALSYPKVFEQQYIREQVDQVVQERLRERIEALFEPVKQAMNDFAYGIKGDLDAISTGLELDVDRDTLPNLIEVLRKNATGQKLLEVLGAAASKDEGISFVRIGLTQTLADPESFQKLLNPDGIPSEWQSYLNLARLEWADAPYSLLRNTQRLTRSTEGLDSPNLSSSADLATFLDVFFEEDGPLFDPREFTDPEGRRYLVWKTIDLPETNRPMEEMPDGLVESVWRQEQARKLAMEAAEALADRVRKQSIEGKSPAEALDQIAAESGYNVGSTGARLRAESLDAFAPINAGEELRDTMFRLGDSGEEAVAVAPDRSRDVAYTLVFNRRSDSSLGGELLSSSGINYENALSNLQFFLRSDVEPEMERKRYDAVISFLRKEAGIEPDWSPEQPDRG